MIAQILKNALEGSLSPLHSHTLLFPFVCHFNSCYNSAQYLSTFSIAIFFVSNTNPIIFNYYFSTLCFTSSPFISGGSRTHSLQLISRLAEQSP